MVCEPPYQSPRCHAGHMLDTGRDWLSYTDLGWTHPIGHMLLERF